jgi:cytochrome P450
MTKPIPTPDSQSGLAALQALIRERSPLAALQVFHARLGDVFRINLPGFTPVVLVGPQAARFVLTDGADKFRWRNERDPVTELLRHGVLVEDGESHDRLRHLIGESMPRSAFDRFVEIMVRRCDEVTAAWPAEGVVDMLVEMRKITLLILLEALYRVDIAPDLSRLWRSILTLIRSISPGLWMLWRGAPRPGYAAARQTLDAYLYGIITQRRAALAASPGADADDMLSRLIQAGLDDDLIRDQLLTILIAGHDTSTACLSWTLYLLGRHPAVLQRVQHEVDSVLGAAPPTREQISHLETLGRVVRESLRLYPPIHLGSRVAAADVEFDGFTIPAGERVIYSIYLTQRHPAHWPNPDAFDPDRYAREERPGAFTFLGFGGGARNCLGSGFGLMEVRVVLARLLQQFDLDLVERAVHAHMGATLEPHPGVRMRVRRRVPLSVALATE